MSALSSAQKGARAEARAAEYVVSRGGEILRRNYRVRGAEIDLIAREGNCVVFIEVKYRGNAADSAREAVTLAKRRRVCMAAARFLQESGLAEQPIRFDIIEVFPKSIACLRAAFDTVGMEENASAGRYV